MNSQPTVSICLPTFNGERYLEKAIASALQQSFDDFELVICDDCSTDATVEIIQRYAAADPRLLWCKNDARKGLFSNYNECLKRARGRFIRLFAQDDLLHPEAVKRAVVVMEQHPQVALVSCGKEVILDGGLHQPPASACDANRPLDGQAVAAQLLIGLSNFIGEPSAVMFRGDVVQSGFDPHFYHLGDTDLWVRVLSAGDYFHLDEPLCTFRQHSCSATTRNLRGLLFAPDFLRLGDKYGELLEGQGMSREAYRRRVVECLASFLGAQLEAGLTWPEVAEVHSGLTAGSHNDNLTAVTHGRSAALGPINPFVEIAYLSLAYAHELQERLEREHREWSAAMSNLSEQVKSVGSSGQRSLIWPLRKLVSLLPLPTDGRG